MPCPHRSKDDPASLCLECFSPGITEPLHAFVTELIRQHIEKEESHGNALPGSADGAGDRKV